MNFVISTFVMMVLFFTGMAQSKSMNPTTAYTIAGVAGAIAMILAIVRYSQQKKAGK